ncbi:MAG: methyltransferase [Alphaproteobacteria bacterium]|nr:methyltransferase [Alphaproteobacteria bacterium]
MSDWAEGYLVDIGYTFGYYSELNPLRARLAMLKSGYAMPKIATACELGFGQGLSINMHAAASDIEWYGTDFNPSHTAFAGELAATGTGANLYDQAFIEFCNRTDLPEFDYIGLHGIWSWISAQNRDVIIDFLRRKLKVGGLCYISYNTYPGWATVAPLRHLLNEHADTMSPRGIGILPRIDAALKFVESLLDANPLYARAHPGAAERLKSLRNQDRNYLAGEYFNDHWDPMYFSDVADLLSSAKLNYLASASYRDHVDALNLSDQQQALLRDIPDPMFRETVRDFIVNQQFRRDYWIRGGRALPAANQIDLLRQEHVVLTSPREDVQLEVTGTRGKATLNEDVYTPFLDAVADGKVKTLGDIEEAMKSAGKNFSQVLQAAVVLVGKGDMAPAQDEAATAAVTSRTDALNAHLLSLTRAGRGLNYLDSPVLGGAVAVSYIQQLLLLAHQQGLKKTDERIRWAWDVFNSHGRRITREGRTIEGQDEALAEFTREAKRLQDKSEPVLKSLGIL